MVTGIVPVQSIQSVAVNAGITVLTCVVGFIVPARGNACCQDDNNRNGRKYPGDSHERYNTAFFRLCEIPSGAPS
jgi:hypothetical protein